MNKDRVIQYINLRNDYEMKTSMNIVRIITDTDKQLINEINSYALQDKEFMNILNSMSNINPSERIKVIEEYFNKKEEVKEASVEEKEISKTFGIDISNINHKFLNNGNEIFYFYDLKLGRDVVLQNNKNGKTLVEQLKEMQQENEMFQTQNNEANTNNMLEQQINNSDIELKMVTLNDIRNNPNITNSMNKDDLNKLNYLINNYNNLNIKVINLENMLYIDNNNSIREVIYNKEKNQYYTEEPQSANYQEENQKIELANPSYENVETYNYNDKYSVEQEKNIEVESFDDLSEQIKNQTMVYYDYPEILDKMDDLEEKKKWQHYIELYAKKLEQEKLLQNKEQPKEKVKKDNKKAGYADALLLSLITGFTFGIFVTLTTILFNK